MLETEVQSLDPQVATDGTSFEVIADYTDGLMQMDADGAAVPAIAETYDITHLGATVSPANPYSLSNALACGFTIRARREMYGGFDRYLLAKEL